MISSFALLVGKEFTYSYDVAASTLSEWCTLLVSLVVDVFSLYAKLYEKLNSVSIERNIEYCHNTGNKIITLLIFTSFADINLDLLQQIIVINNMVSNALRLKITAPALAPTIKSCVFELNLFPTDEGIDNIVLVKTSVLYDTLVVVDGAVYIKYKSANYFWIAQLFLTNHMLHDESMMLYRTRSSNIQIWTTGHLQSTIDKLAKVPWKLYA